MKHHIFSSTAAVALLVSADLASASVIAVGDPLGIYPLNLATTPNAGNQDITIGRAVIIAGTVYPRDSEVTVDAVGSETEISTTGSIRLGLENGGTGTLNVVGDGSARSAIATAGQTLDIGGGSIAFTNGTGSLNISNGGAVLLKYDPSVPSSFGALDAGVAANVNGLDELEADILVTGSTSELVADSRIILGNAISGSTARMRVLDGASVSSAIVRDFGGGPRNTGSVQIAEGSELLVDGSGSNVLTNRLIAGFGTFTRDTPSNPGNAAATVTVSNGGKIVTGSDNQGAVIGWGARADMLVTGTGSEFIVNALPSDDGAPASLGDEGDLVIGLTTQNYVPATDSYQFVEAAGSLVIRDDAKVTVADEVRIGGTDTYFKSLTQSFYPGLVVPSSSGLVEVSSGGELVAERVIVGENGILMGDGGTITADVVLDGGTVAPGTSPGILNVDGDFTILKGILDIEIGGTLWGEYDVLNITGDLFAYDPFEIHLSFLDSFFPSDGDTFDFLNVDGDASSFEALLASFQVGFQIFGLGDGNSIDFDFSGGSFRATTNVTNSPSQVPLPASLPMLLAGFAGLGIWRRRTPKIRKAL